MVLHALTIFAGAFLLFLVQPLIAKQILPWFGGSAAVWTTCLAFFQVMLLLGYAYAHCLTQWSRPRTQAIVHAVLLLVSLVCLPIVAGRGWEPQGNEDPGARILGLLLVTIGLPYFLLSANGPLLQAWSVRSVEAKRVYRLFALSNLASLLALVSYPFAIEPWVTTRGQAIAWSIGYGAFAVLCITVAWTGWRKAMAAGTAVSPAPVADAVAVPAEAARSTLHRELVAMAVVWLVLALVSTRLSDSKKGLFHWLADLTGTFRDASWLDLFSDRLWVVTKAPSGEWLGDDGLYWAWLLFQGGCVLLCAGAAWWAWHRRNAARAEPGRRAGREFELWVALPMMSTWLLVAVTNHIQQNVAAVPFLWLLPLSLYLLTFILCFDRAGWYQRWLFVPLLMVLLMRAAFALQTLTLTLNIKVAVLLYLAMLFVVCMCCHGELAARKPEAKHLTAFYLAIALGGALGGMVVGLLAPWLLDFPYELGTGLALTALVVGIALWRYQRVLTAVALVAAAACVMWLCDQVANQQDEAVELQRNFYGSLCVKEDRQFVPDATRRLVHGVILHGAQFLDPQHRGRVTTYYGPSSGVGLAMKRAGEGKRVGVIGLGTGSVAAWGGEGDLFRFYDINPQVIDIAQRRFTFLSDTRAKVEIALGDARLCLQREEPQRFDVLVVDAFSSDAIPVHLITTEAMVVYLRHLAPDGVIAFHVTNRYLKLAPVVAQLADVHRMHAVLIADDDPDPNMYRSDWVLVGRSEKLTTDPLLETEKRKEIAMPKGLRLWTDDYNNLFDILKGDD